MSHHKIFLSAALVILLTSTGCSKSRWLSRNDYSEMHDPFMEGESAVAETPAVPKASNGAGRARLDDSDTASISMAQVPSSRTAATGGPLSGPKPIQQASGTAAARPPVSQASYPQDAAGQSAGIPRSNLAAKKGPSLSDFMSQPGSAESAGHPTASAATAAASSEDAGFMNWAKQQEPPTVAARPTAAGGPAAAAAFGEIERAEPLIPATPVSTAATSSGTGTGAGFGTGTGAVNGAGGPVTGASMSRVLPSQSSQPKPSAPMGTNPFAEIESQATASPVRTASAAPPEFELPTEESGVTTPSPFGETIRPAKPAETTPLDANFMQDTGWKPSSLSRP